MKGWLRVERGELMKNLPDMPDPNPAEENFSGVKSTALGIKSMGMASRMLKQKTERTLHHRETLNADERVQLQMMDDRARRRFIGQELRARRYLLLPQIYVWEDDMRSYLSELHEWRETKRALAVVTDLEDAWQKAGPMPWPPAKPSYIPSDEELLLMYRRARKDPRDVTQIPTKRRRNSRSSRGKLPTSPREVRQKSEADSADMGKADLDMIDAGFDDDQLRSCWAMDLESMMGVAVGSF